MAYFSAYTRTVRVVCRHLLFNFKRPTINAQQQQATTAKKFEDQTTKVGLFDGVVYMRHTNRVKGGRDSPPHTARTSYHWTRDNLLGNSKKSSSAIRYLPAASSPCGTKVQQ